MKHFFEKIHRQVVDLFVQPNASAKVAALPSQSKMYPITDRQERLVNSFIKHLKENEHVPENSDADMSMKVRVYCRYHKEWGMDVQTIHIKWSEFRNLILYFMGNGEFSFNLLLYKDEALYKKIDSQIKRLPGQPYCVYLDRVMVSARNLLIPHPSTNLPPFLQ